MSPYSPGVSEASFGVRTESAVGGRRLLLPMGEGNRVLETRGSRSPPMGSAPTGSQELVTT